MAPEKGAGTFRGYSYALIWSAVVTSEKDFRCVGAM